ncbi:hypothetical protein GJ496_006270 [Pomphorhynchus laevis]|nr:hypothetical protein GJ496_006270 [Pomphorhynchus laevis]
MYAKRCDGCNYKSTSLNYLKDTSKDWKFLIESPKCHLSTNLTDYNKKVKQYEYTVPVEFVDKYSDDSTGEPTFRRSFAEHANKVIQNETEKLDRLLNIEQELESQLDFSLSTKNAIAFHSKVIKTEYPRVYASLMQMTALLKQLNPNTDITADKLTEILFRPCMANAFLNVESVKEDIVPLDSTYQFTRDYEIGDSSVNYDDIFNQLEKLSIMNAIKEDTLKSLSKTDRIAPPVDKEDDKNRFTSWTNEIRKITDVTNDNLRKATLV